jgi:hypothetical protein
MNDREPAGHGRSHPPRTRATRTSARRASRIAPAAGKDASRSGSEREPREQAGERQPARATPPHHEHRGRERQCEHRQVRAGFERAEHELRRGGERHEHEAADDAARHAARDPERECRGRHRRDHVQHARREPVVAAERQAERREQRRIPDAVERVVLGDQRAVAQPARRRDVRAEQVALDAVGRRAVQHERDVR